MDIIINKDLLNENVAYQNSNANEFQEYRNRLVMQNYEITNFIVDKNGIFKLTAELKFANLTKCLLKEKQLPIKDRVYPPSSTKPYLCDFNINGVCTCCDFNSCLYQKTPEHEAVLSHMADIYEKSSKDGNFTDASNYYEDTEYGRIFSGLYNHLNKRFSDCDYNYRRLHGE